MPTTVAKRSLSSSRKRLVELMQQLNFGKIEGLQVHDREPVLEPLPRITQEIKFAAAENGPRPELGAGNFLLKAQVVELFEQFDRLGNGTVELIEIKHGLPFRMFVAGQTP
jgi:hypothetical protein